MWRPSELGEVFVTRQFRLRRGVKRSVVLRIGRPIKDPTTRRSGDWCVPLQIDGLGPGKLVPVWGVDGLQALVLALDYARRSLTQWTEEAEGTIFWLDEFDTLFGESRLQSYQFVAYLRLLEGLREVMEHLERELSPRTVWRDKRRETRRLLDRVSALVETGGVVPRAVETLTGLDRARRYMPKRRRPRKRA
jgi:hypothetical protein